MDEFGDTDENIVQSNHGLKAGTAFPIHTKYPHIGNHLTDVYDSQEGVRLGEYMTSPQPKTG